MIVWLIWLGLTLAAVAEELPLPEVIVEGEDLSKPPETPVTKPSAIPAGQDLPLPLPDLAPRQLPDWQFRTDPVLLAPPDPAPSEPPTRLEVGAGGFYAMRLSDQRELAGLASRLHAQWLGGPRWYRQELAAEGAWSSSDDPASDRLAGQLQLFQFGRGASVFQGARLQLGWHGGVNAQLAVAADNVNGTAGWGARTGVDGVLSLAEGHELRWRSAGEFRQEQLGWFGGQLEAADRFQLGEASIAAGLGAQTLLFDLLPYPVIEVAWPFWADTQLSLSSLSTLEAPFLTLYHERVAPKVRADLRPERGWGGQLRIERRFSPAVRFALGASGQAVSNWIYWQPIETAWQPLNSTELASRVGLTADVETRWSGNLTQTWGYTMRYGLIKSLRQGEQQLGSTLAWRWPGLPLDGHLGLRLQAWDLDSQRPLHLLLDGALAYHVTESIQVQLRAENWQLTAIEANTGWWEPTQLLSAGIVARF